MFERFTKRAQAVVRAGIDVASASGAAEVRPDHLLVAVLRDESSLATRVLVGLGAVPQDVVARIEGRDGFGVGLDEEDAEALATIGIDLEEVLRAIGDEQPRSRRRPKFARASKKVLELALREALALRHNYIGTEHMLLGMVRAGDPVMRDVLQGLDVTPTQLRVAVAAAVRKAG
jgi:ATP-dependent Clp protease ATP-binding subunit ClpA